MRSFGPSMGAERDEEATAEFMAAPRRSLLGYFNSYAEARQAGGRETMNQTHPVLGRRWPLAPPVMVAAVVPGSLSSNQILASPSVCLFVSSWPSASTLLVSLHRRTARSTLVPHPRQSHPHIHVVPSSSSQAMGGFHLQPRVVLFHPALRLRHRRCILQFGRSAKTSRETSRTGWYCRDHR